MGGVSQPSGEVTLVFSDIEGSTRLLHELGTDAYREALGDHRRVVREAYARYAGYEVDYEGDAFFYAFPSASDAVSAVSEAMAGLDGGPISIRVGIHTGEPVLDPPKYVGMDVHFAARVMSCAHGGQVVLSTATAERIDVPLLELGEHRLKDIEQAVPLYQLGEGAFPPLKTISNTNLPHPASSFLGRAEELAAIVSRIEQGARLVTLTGPGGTGKTRLAVEAASSLVGSYKAGLFWVGLSSLRDPALVLETIAQTLGAKGDLAEHIGERELLLLLDNMEQVIEAAPELSMLLEACPNLTLLVTSRELLRIQGEVEYAVPPLAEPEAVSLFCERAQVDPREEIAELCARLDSLPLAVELAAARTKALTPAQILDRLSQRLDLLKGGRDADPRQQTLRATIEWSYDLLTEGEQRLFARLSVFAGGCTLEAAEDVCEADLDTLQSLVEKSLVRFTNERYWMLETIREYSGERLGVSGQADQVQERHVRHFARLLTEAEPHLRGNDRVWVLRLEREHDNVRAALDRLEEQGEGERLLEMLGAAWRFWYLKSHFAEGRRRLEDGLALSPASSERGSVLHGTAVMSVHMGDSDTATRLTHEALRLHRARADRSGTAYSLMLLGNLAAERGEMADAWPLHEESARLFREAGEEDYALVATVNLAWALSELGERERARALHEENLEQARRRSNVRLEGAVMAQLAMLVRADDPARARTWLTAATRISQELGDPAETANDLCRAACLLVEARRTSEAAQLVSRATAIRQEIGADFEAWAAVMNNETLACARRDLGDGFAAAWSRGRALSVDEAVELALASID